ncbi:MAG: nitroreductase family protein [Dysgonamonadaceae bacterium]|jgi:nitroreductase|nr:nitroreductase family protein [Dysgonamonadaceae bacterium]
MDFHQLLIQRRSTRKYTEEPLSPDESRLILEAALLSPTSKNAHSWEFIAVEDKATLEKLSVCKPNNAKMIANASLAVVVLGNPFISDAWVEDASIAAINMQLQAEDLGVGSCWVQVRGRDFAEPETAGEYINRLLDVPMPLEVLCVLAFGHKMKVSAPNDSENLLWDKVHIEKYETK